MLYEVLKTIKNFFPKESYHGLFEIENGRTALSFLKDGQYFLVKGSIFNDGVHQYTSELVLKDEVFWGTITALAIPKDFLDLVTDIEDWQSSNAVGGPFQSESFGGYSYTRATDASGNTAGWQTVFASRLNHWRKL